MGFLLLVFTFSAAQSVVHRSYMPYLYLPVGLAMASLTVLRYAKLKIVSPKPAWLSAAHYGILVLFLCVLLYFFGK